MTCSKLLYESVKSFVRDKGSMFAGSMSFFAIMSLVPFCLFIMTLIGFTIGEDPEMQKFIISKIVELFPEVTRGITEELMKLVSYRGIGIFSFVLYAFLSFQLLKSAEFAVNAIFKIPSKRAIHHSLLVSVGIITLMIILFLASFFVATVGSAPPFLKRFLPEFEISILESLLLRFIMPFILTWLILALLYITLPFRRPRILYALKSAFIISILLEVAKHAFTWYIGNITRLGHIYGSLTTFIIFFLWVYYSSCIFLIGAEMITVLTNEKEEVYEPSYW